MTIRAKIAASINRTVERVEDADGLKRAEHSPWTAILMPVLTVTRQVCPIE